MSAFIVGLAMSILWVSSSVSGDRSHLDVVGLPVSLAESAHGEALTVFAQERVDYAGVKVQGPFKSGHWLFLMLVCSFPYVTLQACMEGIHVVIIELQGSVQLFSEIDWAGSEGLEGMKVDNTIRAEINSNDFGGFWN